MKYKLEGGSINANTLGAGSGLDKDKARNLKHISKFGISSLKQSEILVNLCEWLQARTVLELGTSLGLNAAYLSQSKGMEEVVTVEGNESLANESQANFQKLGLNNVRLMPNDIDAFFAANNQKFDLIYIDANHTYEATVRYFKQALSIINPKGVIAIDDINWSAEMKKAWTTVQSLAANALSIENDKIGIVFVNIHSDNKHYILRF